MNRRSALRSVGVMLVAPTLVFGQTAKRYRLGWLFSSDEATTRPLFAAFIERMRAMGYAEGKNLVNDRRWADGDVSRYAPLADELIALKPDVLLAIQEPARVLKAKTSVIPIVLLSSADPVGVGLVKS